MSGLLPVAVYGLKVPAGDVMIPAIVDFPATFRITMAAIDPTAAPEHTGTVDDDTPARATLKVIYDPSGPGDENSDDSDEEDEYLKALLEGRESDDDEDDDDDESSSDDEEINGGPSDPSKTKKARKEAAVQQMLQALAEQDSGDSEDEMDVDTSAGMKGKGKAVAEGSDEDEIISEDDTEGSLDGMEELVVCTLDPEKNYQQTLDLTIPEDQRAFFKVSGTHAIYLTGNYVVPADNGHSHGNELYDGDDDEAEYDMSPDEDELDDDEESDDLDVLEDPRITEVGSDDDDGDEVPKLIKKDVSAKKGKNKRPAEDSDEEPASLDDIMAKSLNPVESATNGEPKLSKKQQKKLKNNAGKAVDAAIESKDVKVDDAAKDKGDKKVQFAKDLEQGPSSSPSTLKADSNGDAKAGGKPSASLGPKVVQGVKVDDKKLGKGLAAKKGDKVGMRYIGKLNDGKVFDANKSGKPFTFKLGSGEVIKGWDIGVEGMSVGGERRIVIPASLAYGKKGMPGIPKNSELTFDMKLLEIH